MATVDQVACGDRDWSRRAPGESDLVRQMAELVDAMQPNELQSPSAVRDIVSCVEMLSAVWRRSSGSTFPSLAEATPALWDHLESSDCGTDASRRFEIRALLGHGGFGVVMLAFDRRLCREVALKIPRPEILVLRDMRERFLREAQTAAVLDHPNIVPVYDTGEIGPIWFITSRYIAGPTLSEWLRDIVSQPSCRTAARLVQNLAEAVHHAHSRGVLHRDLKPANVLLEPTAEAPDSAFPFLPRLSDFGLAKWTTADDGCTRADALVGTPKYMAPEQAAGRPKEVGIHSDVYGLGVILYEILTGKPPFDGETDVEILRRIQEEPVPAAPLRQRRVAPDLETICLKCLEKRPARRYETAGELAADLRRYLAGEPVLARPLTHVERLLRWCHRRPLQAITSVALIAITLIAVAGIAWQWFRAEQNYRTAQQQKLRAEQRLMQVEQAFIDLQWMFEESGMWSSSDDSFSALLSEKLNRYVGNVIPENINDETSIPVVAAYYSMTAKNQSLRNQPDEAEANYAKSLELWCRLLREHPDNREYERAFALTLYSYAAHLLKSGKVSGNAMDFHLVEQVFDKIHLSSDNELRARVEYARLMTSLGNAHASRGRDRDALLAFTLANRMWRDLAQRCPDNHFLASEATTLVAIAVRQMRVNDDLPGALRRCQQARKQMETITARDSVAPVDWFVLAETLRHEAHFTHRSAKPSQAAALYEQAISAYRNGLHGVAPTSQEFEQLGILYQDMARQLRTMHGVTAALDSYELCANTWETLLSAGVLSPRNEERLAMVYFRIGDAHKQLGHPPRAISAFRRSIELFEKLREPPGSNKVSIPTLARSYSELGDELAREGKIPDAVDCHRKAAALFEHLSSIRPTDQRLKQQLHDEESRLDDLEASSVNP